MHDADIYASQIPIHLAELSPPAFRATFPGVAYQLGNVRCAGVLSFTIKLIVINALLDGIIGFGAD
jgi:hypothetical protein